MPPDIRRPVVPLAQLLFVLPAPVLATLCASLLAERRIILTCKDLNTLATATLAASQILSPLRWHHVLLPVVPVAALDVLSSPIPYLVGYVLHSFPRCSCHRMIVTNSVGLLAESVRCHGSSIVLMYEE